MSENKTMTFSIRLSPEEHAAIKAAAKASGRSMSKYFLVAALEMIEKERIVNRAPAQNKKG